MNYVDPTGNATQPDIFNAGSRVDGGNYTGDKYGSGGGGTGPEQPYVGDAIFKGVRIENERSIAPISARTDKSNIGLVCDYSDPSRQPKFVPGLPSNNPLPPSSPSNPSSPATSNPPNYQVILCSASQNNYYPNNRKFGIEGNSYFGILCGGQQEFDTFAETEIDRIGSLFLSGSGDFATTGIGAISPYLSTILDLVMLIPNRFTTSIIEKGTAIKFEATARWIQNSPPTTKVQSWNSSLSFYRIAVGEYWESVGHGLSKGENKKYFSDLSMKLANSTVLLYKQYPVIQGCFLHDLKYLKE
jgi:hypothetical protein